MTEALPPAEMVCAVFVNRGPRTARRVTLSFAMVDAAGTVIGVDVVRLKGSFEAGKPVRYSDGGTFPNAPNRNCDVIEIALSELHMARFSYRPAPHAAKFQVAAVLVSARDIAYDDGTVWRTERVPQGGDRAALPPVPPASVPPPAAVRTLPDIPPERTPRLSAAAPAGSPVEITEVYARDTFTQHVALVGYKWLLDRQTCIVYVNRDARVVTHVRFNFAVVDRHGTIAGVQTYDSRSHDGPGFVKEGVCTNIASRWTDEGLGFLPLGPRGPSVPVGRIIATPIHVDFADGTVWTAPKAPQTGDRVEGFSALLTPAAPRGAR